MKCSSCGAENLEGADECDSCRSPLTERPAAAGLERRILEGRVAELSPRKAVAVGPSDKAQRAVEAMRREKIGCLLVLEGPKLAGVLSEREFLLRPKDPSDLSRTLVKELMRPAEASVLTEDDSVADAFHGMAVTGQRHLAIRLKKGGYGVVSARDLLRYLCA